jgi:raffinose/stachyose/melibiose transport system substrate-binding protein
MKKWYRELMVIMSIAILVVTSCSEKSSESSKAVSGQKIVNYWSFMNEGEPIQIWMQTFINDYEKESGVKVNVVWAGREVLTKVKTRLAAPVADDFPDITDQGSGVLMDIQNKEGIFYPLDDYLAQPNNYVGVSKWSDIYIPSALSVGKAADGKTYLIPRESYINAFFYNKKIFTNLGLSVPKTWEELMAVARKIKESGIAPFSLDGNFDRNCAWWFTRLAEHTVGIDTIRQACEGKIKWSDDPGFLTAAQCLQEIVDKGYFQNNYQGSVWPASQLLWVQSKTAMIPCGTWLVAEMSDSTPPDFEMDIFAWPVIKNEKYPLSEEAWGNYWVMLKDAQHKDAAIDFIKFASQKKYDDAMTKIGSPSAQVNGMPIPQLANQGSILQNGTVVSDVMGGLSTYENYYNNVYNKVITEMMLGQLNAKECLAKLDTETAKYYNK